MRRFGRRMRRALVFSLLLNVTVLSLVLHYYRRPDFQREQRLASTEQVTIQHVLRHVVERAKHTRAASPVTHVAEAPIQKPIVERPVTYARPKLVTPPVALKELPQPKVLQKAYEPKVIASVPHPAAAQKSAPRFNDQQIAAIENSLGDSIARDRDRNNPLNVQANAPAGSGMKHYGLDVSSLTEGGIGHRGLCHPVQSWTADGWDYYYVTCNVRASDGTFDREDIPWPVRYRPNRDPNLGTGPDGDPIAMPLPGWHLTAGQFVADGVRQYAADHGVNL